MTEAGTPDAPPVGAVFVMPRRSTEWANAGGLWITAAGWAAAARRRLGRAWIVTPDALAAPEEALNFTNGNLVSRGRRNAASWAPVVIRTAVKDVLRAHAARRYRDVGEHEEWTGTDVAFVWQHHDLFHDAGAPLARRHRCPLVSFVHAPQVWEARRWGVRRPGWGRLLERIAERPQLLSSDVVACVSREVADELVRLGVDEGRIVVSPMAVDPERFSPAVSGQRVRRRFGLNGGFVIGWVGSFRRFHALEVGIEAFAVLHRQIPDSRFLLAGDGLERARVETLVASLGLGDAVVFAGAVPHQELPEYLAAMDATVVTAGANQGFHYSPLKLPEYMASGRPVVAPRIGDVARTLTEGADALLYDPGDVGALARRLLELHENPELRTKLASAGRALVLAGGTWDVQLERLLDSAAFRDASARLSRTGS